MIATIPDRVQSEGNAKFRVNFKPTEAQPHLISVKFNNEPVPNSPFEVAIRNTSASGGGNGANGANVVVSGNGIKMAAVNKTANFVINAPEEQTKNYSVAISSPTGETVEVGGVLDAKSDFLLLNRLLKCGFDFSRWPR